MPHPGWESPPPGAGTAVGDDQPELLAFQPAPVEIPEQTSPIRLALPWLRKNASK
jgi:hypothetical protein